jgi:glycosyltransferase involved in cell wall biosynthesis
MEQGGDRVRAPLRVLLVDPGGELGGAEVLLDSLVRGADRTRVDPIVVCLQDGSWPGALAADGIEVRVLVRPRLRNVVRVGKVIFGLTRIVRHEHIGVVHANSNSALLYASIAARIGGARQVWHLHDPQSAAGARHRLVLGVLRRSRPDHLIFSSPAASASWLEVWGKPQPQSSIIIPDIDSDRILQGNAQRARAQLGLPAGSPVVAMLARPVAHKGHEDLIRATAILKQSIPAIRVVMTTGWAEASEFRASLRQMAD